VQCLGCVGVGGGFWEGVCCSWSVLGRGGVGRGVEMGWSCGLGVCGGCFLAVRGSLWGFVGVGDVWVGG